MIDIEFPNDNGIVLLLIKIGLPWLLAAWFLHELAQGRRTWRYKRGGIVSRPVVRSWIALLLLMGAIPLDVAFGKRLAGLLVALFMMALFVMVGYVARDVIRDRREFKARFPHSGNFSVQTEDGRLLLAGDLVSMEAGDHDEIVLTLERETGRQYHQLILCLLSYYLLATLIWSIIPRDELVKVGMSQPWIPALGYSYLLVPGLLAALAWRLRLSVIVIFGVAAAGLNVLLVRFSDVGTAGGAWQLLANHPFTAMLAWLLPGTALVAVGRSEWLIRTLRLRRRVVWDERKDRFREVESAADRPNPSPDRRRQRRSVRRRAKRGRRARR